MDLLFQLLTGAQLKDDPTVIYNRVAVQSLAANSRCLCELIITNGLCQLGQARGYILVGKLAVCPTLALFKLAF